MSTAMVQQQHEALIILNPSLATPQDLEAARSEFTVKQSISNRVFIVEADQAELERLRQLPEVAYAIGGEVSPDVKVEHLTDAEALFVDAWSARQQQVKPPRPGDGLSWDAAGFAPPG
ncbi:hypothetical protein IQ260_06145 [Leptolyngbya cf. ectocarpi LEGE 11479]|uniref:Uncharacterized protein n=1 Tax=Leptolyngbya cf. ectocarpi LEGE 11479 TaxID=1828722 RepID=A0A928X289_LEPEC|nr:hypothetical protein [Leptolyngbya ectocarpi]MBE9066229.1 hypothetical protein [Leptolyngbya cf. ectocarpi LEGE 11479]